MDEGALIDGRPCRRDESTRKPGACIASTMDGSSKGDEVAFCEGGGGGLDVASLGESIPLFFSRLDGLIVHAVDSSSA